MGWVGLDLISPGWVKYAANNVVKCIFLVKKTLLIVVDGVSEKCNVFTVNYCVGCRAMMEPRYQVTL